MFLEKKNCEFVKRLDSHNTGQSVYKLFRNLFSMGTINKKLTYLKDNGMITIEKDGRINEITFTTKGREVLKSIYKLEELTCK